MNHATWCWWVSQPGKIRNPSPLMIVLWLGGSGGRLLSSPISFIMTYSPESNLVSFVSGKCTVQEMVFCCP